MKIYSVYLMLLKACIIFAVSVKVSSNLDIVEIISKMNDQGNTTELSERIYRRLDNIENVFLKTWRHTKYQRNIVKAFMGGLILLYGGKFTNTILLIQALSVSSLSSLGSSFSELYKSYKQSKKMLREELPVIIKTEADLADLIIILRERENSLRHLKRNFTRSAINETEFAENSVLLEKQIVLVNQMIDNISVINNPFAHVRKVINPKHVQEIFNAMYHSIIIGMATVHSQAIGNVAMGLHIGKVACNRITKFFHNHPNDGDNGDEMPEPIESAAELLSTNVAWVEAALIFATRAAGVVLSFVMNETLEVISACSLGTDILINGLQSLLDPILMKMKLGTIKESPKVTAAVHAILVFLGVKLQMFTADKVEIHPLLRVILLPVLILEGFLKKMVMTNGLF